MLMQLRTTSSSVDLAQLRTDFLTGPLSDEVGTLGEQLLWSKGRFTPGQRARMPQNYCEKTGLANPLSISAELWLLSLLTGRDPAL